MYGMTDWHGHELKLVTEVERVLEVLAESLAVLLCGGRDGGLRGGDAPRGLAVSFTTCTLLRGSSSHQSETLKHQTISKSPTRTTRNNHNTPTINNRLGKDTTPTTHKV